MYKNNSNPPLPSFSKGGTGKFLNPSDKSIIIISGPTASGKSQIALSVVRKLDLEIVNADSMQVYRYLDIGTAKPSLNDRKLIKHHLIDIVDPDEQYDAGRYVEETDNVIANLLKEKKFPLIVGGTGLYIKALIFGLFHSPPKDLKIRNDLKLKVKSSGIENLYSELKQTDPLSAQKIKPTDTQRILRTLEVFLITGKPTSFFQSQHGFRKPRYKYLYFCLRREKEELNKRIEARVDKMIETGFEEEVRNLLEMGYSYDLNSLKSLGYKEMIGYINGKYNLSETINLIKKNARHYAKRQLTWFKAQPDVVWIDLKGDDIEAPAKEIKERMEAFCCP